MTFALQGGLKMQKVLVFALQVGVKMQKVRGRTRFTERTAQRSTLKMIGQISRSRLQAGRAHFGHVPLRRRPRV